jgi:hypothetical protein
MYFWVPRRIEQWHMDLGFLRLHEAKDFGITGVPGRSSQLLAMS